MLLVTETATGTTDMRLSGNERRAVAYAASAHSLVHVLELTYAAVLVSIKAEFGSGLFLLGMVANVSAFAYGATAIPSGFLADRFGSRRMLLVCLLAAAATSMLVALSPTMYVLAVSLTVLGLAIGLYHPVGLSFISRSVRLRSLGMGYHGMAGNLGVALAPLMAAWLASAISWRAAYMAFGVLALIVAAILFLSRNPQISQAPVPAGTPSAQRGMGSTLAPLAVVYMVSMVGGFIYRGSMTFLPLYLKEQVHIQFLGLDNVVLAGSFATIALLFGVPGQYLGGSLAQRMQLERVIVPLAALVVPALILMGLTSGLALVIFASAFVFFNFMAQPAYNSLVAEYTPARWQGSSYGISFFFTFGLGSFAAGFSGYIAEKFGTQWVFLTLGGFAILLLALALYLFWAARLRAQQTEMKPAGVKG